MENPFPDAPFHRMFEEANHAHCDRFCSTFNIMTKCFFTLATALLSVPFKSPEGLLTPLLYGLSHKAQPDTNK